VGRAKVDRGVGVTPGASVAVLLVDVAELSHTEVGEILGSSVQRRVERDWLLFVARSELAAMPDLTNHGNPMRPHLRSKLLRVLKALRRR